MFQIAHILRSIERHEATLQRSRIGWYCARIGSTLLLVGAAMACSSGDGDSGTSERACVPGQSVACVGPQGCNGFQVCSDDGAAFASCSCASGQGGNSSTALGQGGTGVGGSLIARGSATGNGGATNTATSTGPAGGATSSVSTASGGVVSSSAGGVGTTSVGGSGISSSGGAATSCPPASMVGWTAPSYVPARPKQKVCTDAEIRAYVDQCLKGGDCSAFATGAASAECGACMAPSATTDAALGPILQVTPSPFYRWETNFAGCTELLGAQSCAPKLQAASICASESCNASCDPSSSAYDGCVAQARNSTCNAYSQLAVCLTDATVASRCSGNDFTTSVLAMGRVFCGV